MGTKIIVPTGSAVAAGAATARTALAYKAPAGVGARVLRFGVSFDGTNSTDARAIVDFIKNPASAGTPANDVSSSIAVTSGLSTSVGNGYTDYGGAVNEPAVSGSAKQIRQHFMAPTGPYEATLNIDLAPAELFCLRTKGATGKTVNAWMEVELG